MVQCDTFFVTKLKYDSVQVHLNKLECREKVHFLL